MKRLPRQCHEEVIDERHRKQEVMQSSLITGAAGFMAKRYLLIETA